MFLDEPQIDTRNRDARARGWSVRPDETALGILVGTSSADPMDVSILGKIV